MSLDDFTELAGLFSTETVTHSLVQDVPLPGIGTLALVTLDNGLDHRKPTTLGPNTLLELGRTLESLAERASKGEIQAVGITGKPYFLVAGADLTAVSAISKPEHGLAMAQLGHEVYGLLRNLPVPSFAFINGLALGGGLEIALQSTYRTVSASAGALGLPEAFLGLLPGGGGAYLLPPLLAPEVQGEVAAIGGFRHIPIVDGSRLLYRFAINAGGRELLSGRVAVALRAKGMK